MNPVHVPAIVGSASVAAVEHRRLHWPNESHTQAFARQLAACAGIGQALIELQGDLGAGKTSMARHLLRALGVTGRIKSPTYAVVEPYQVNRGNTGVPLDIWHFDFYRFDDPGEWDDAGFRDLFACPGLKLVEWAEKARAMLPTPDLVIALEAMPDDSRQVTLQAATALGRSLLP